MSSVEPIRRLPDALVAKIAAGEVVERPASVAKELIENALDAGSTSIDVEYDDRDGRRVAVTDDGSGIEPDQVRLALTRHATSKISCLDDLEHIVSLGFRGEALASIAAVAEVEVTTRTRRRDDATRVLMRGGKVLDFAESGFSPGTRVDVRNLFAEVPAREKFLKTKSTEFSVLADNVKWYALGYPNVGFSLSHNGRKVVSYPGVSSRAMRIAQVMGTDNSSAMITVEARHGTMRIEGHTSGPGLSHGSNRWIALFVNRRWVRDRLVFRALMDAYRTYLLRGRYPASVLFLEIEPEAMDVNVHPAKTEVRFGDPAAVQRFVVEAVRTALREAASPLGRWGSGRPDLELKESLYRARGYVAPANREVDEAKAGSQSTAKLLPLPGSRSAPSGYRRPAHAEVGATTAEEQANLGFDDAETGGSLAGLEVVGQVLQGYIVCRSSGAVVLVDQHAAHERFLFEQLMSTYTQRPVLSQPLLLPLVIELPEADVEALDDNREWLSRAGWVVEALGPGEVILREQPLIAVKSDSRAVVEAVAADLLELGRGVAVSRLVEKVMATVACHAAIRVGQRLDRNAARELLAEVASVGVSASCPHGRPVARTLSRQRIERLFDR